MSDTEEYTPPTEEVREDWVSTVITPGDYYDPISEEEARARWNRWLERVKAEAKAEVVSQLEWLGTARAEYSHEMCQSEAQTAEQLARIIDGTNDAAGWLPSWRWDEWAAIRAAAENGESDD